MKNKDKDQNLMLSILKNYNIEMNVDGCGCCGSPYVKFLHKGRLIFEGENASFQTARSEVVDEFVTISVDEYERLLQMSREYEELKKYL